MLVAASAACGGGPSGGAPAAVTPSATLVLKAKNVKFDKKALASPASTDVVLVLNNQDAGTLHNFALYRAKDAKDKLFVGDLFTGKRSVEYRFHTPEAGTYYFRCDAHPDMKGTFTATPASG